MTIDILGVFLASQKGHPYFIIFFYLKRHGLTHFQRVPDNELLRHFNILLGGFIRKAVTAAKGGADPQVALLKRRVTDILRTHTYTVMKRPGDRHSYIVLSQRKHQLRESCHTIPDDRLYELVLDAFLNTNSRADWCMRIFELLDAETEYRNEVALNSLISTMIAVNAEYVDALEYTQDRPSGPLGELRLRKIRKAVERASLWISDVGARAYIEKGRLAESDAHAVIEACCTWLNDLCLSGAADSIPSYFLELRHDINQQEYQSRYKYVMDTLSRQALEEVRRILREDSTIWPLGDYLPDE
ncbi:MAG: hypothetical protein AB1772_06950 [Candidatus Zixiibacteriota bacterium]